MAAIVAAVPVPLRAMTCVVPLTLSALSVSVNDPVSGPDAEGRNSAE